MENKNTILKAIDYLGIYANKSEKFEDFKFIGKSIDNPLKVSYISQKKINSLLEYTETKIIGTKEQRNKHFTSTSIQKLLQQMFINESYRTENIAIDIDKQLRKDFCKDSQLFIEDDVAGFYSQEITDTYIYNSNGSCMNKKPISYFGIYDKFIDVRTQIVGLKVGKSVIARALLWTKESETQGTQYFLDRIYIASEFQNSNPEELQNKLFNKIKRALRIKRLDCCSITHIKNGQNTGAEKLNYFNAKSYPNFYIQINQDTFNELEKYPYMDSFRWAKELTDNYSFSADEERADIILESTEGEFTEGGANICDCCDERVNEDYGSYSEVDNEFLCEDCGVYLEDREDTCRESNAIYDSYREVYCYDGDF